MSPYCVVHVAKIYQSQLELDQFSILTLTLGHHQYHRFYMCYFFNISQY